MQRKLASALEGLWQPHSPAGPHPVPKHEGTSDSGLALQEEHPHGVTDKIPVRVRTFL